MTVQALPQQAISFKGRSLLAFVLTPRMPVDLWLAELDAWLDRSPGFFNEKPVVLEICGLSLSGQAYGDFIQDLARRRLRVMAVEGAAPEHLGDDLPPQVSGGRVASAAAVFLLGGFIIVAVRRDRTRNQEPGTRNP